MKKSILLVFMFFLISVITFASFPVTEPVEASITEIAEPIVYDDSAWPNIVSLSCAIVALLMPYTLEGVIVALGLFVAAIVFGSIGFNRKVKGMGIAGFVLGILGAIAMTIVLAVEDYY